MDLIRECYSTRMRLYQDSDETIKVRWYFCEDGALPLAVPHRFGSGNWAYDRQNWDGPGEVLGATRKTCSCEGCIPIKPARGLGTPDQFRNGCKATDPVKKIPTVRCVSWKFQLVWDLAAEVTEGTALAVDRFGVQILVAADVEPQFTTFEDGMAMGLFSALTEGTGYVTAAAAALLLTATVDATADRGMSLGMAAGLTTRATEGTAYAGRCGEALSLTTRATEGTAYAGRCGEALSLTASVAPAAADGTAGMAVGLSSFVADGVGYSGRVGAAFALSASVDATADRGMSLGMAAGLTTSATEGTAYAGQCGEALSLTASVALAAADGTAGMAFGLSSSVADGVGYSGRVGAALALLGAVDATTADGSAGMALGVSGSYTTTDAVTASPSVRASTFGTSGLGSCTLSVPAGTISGDIMVAAVSSNFGSGSINTPSGWTQLQAGTWNGGSGSYWIGYRVAGGSEPSSYTVTSTSGATTLNGAAVTIKDASAPNHSTAATGNSSGPAATGATASSGSASVVFYDNAGMMGTFTAPSGYTVLQPTGFVMDSRRLVEKDGVSGATGTVTAGLSSSSQWVALLATVPP